jgi:dephospho-CoA kinase
LRKLIGIAGRAHSGKTTAAQHLEKMGYRRLSFAEPIKWLAVRHFGVSEEEAFKTKPPSVRHILQCLGMALRQVAPGYLLDQMTEKLEEAQGLGVVIDDIRLREEAEYVRKRQGAVVRVECPDGKRLATPFAMHVTETEPAEVQCDFRITAPYGQLQAVKAGIELVARGS